MSENKWTPGPWTKGRYGDLTGSNGKKVCVYDAGIGLAMCDPAAEDRANAALIAAAPAMAEALEALLKWVAPIAGDNRDDDASENELKTVQMAEAALSLARGETE